MEVDDSENNNSLRELRSEEVIENVNNVVNLSLKSSRNVEKV